MNKKQVQGQICDNIVGSEAVTNLSSLAYFLDFSNNNVDSKQPPVGAFVS